MGYSPEQKELLDAMQIMIDNTLNSQVTKIYSCIMYDIGNNKQCTILLNGQTHAVQYYGDEPTVGQQYKVFVPFNNMAQAFVITGGSAGSDPSTGNYSQLINKPSINSVMLSNNKTSADLGLYGAGNQPPYPVSSFNGRTGAIISTSGDYSASQITGLQTAVSTNTDVAANTVKRHDPVTLGTANGLSLSGQQVSLALATTSVAGAMSAADKTKLNGVATGANNYTLPVATASVLGGVKSGTDISVDSSGNVTVSNANKLNSQDGAYYLNRSNHTGTQLASTISDFVASVRATVLTGLSTATNAVITASDTVLTALGKLQAQITAHISNKSNPHEVTVSQIGAVPTTRTVNSKPLSGDVTLTASDVGALPSATVIPTQTSQLTNNSGFITSVQAPVQSVNGQTGTVSLSIPTKTSDLTNDNGFITSAQSPVQSVNGKSGTVVLTQDDVGNGTTYVQTQNNYTTTEKTKLSGIATGAQVNVIEFVKRNGVTLTATGKAVDIVVPTKTSEVTNDSGFITSAGAPVQSVNGTTGIVNITSVTGNAGTATKLATSKTIAISGGATGTATAFDGSTNITIPVTSLDATKLTGTATISTTGNAATATSATKATQDGNGSTISTTYAKLASPTLTGTPKAPTATAGTNTTQIATTAFVTRAVSSAGGNVTYLSATAPTSPKTGDTWYQIL